MLGLMKFLMNASLLDLSLRRREADYFLRWH